MRDRTADDLAAGRTALRDAGIADDDTAVETLAPLTGRSIGLDLALVERLATSADEAHAIALRDLAAAAEIRGWKSVAKDARRALYRFGQRGIVPPAAPAEPAPKPRWAAGPAFEGWLSGIDGRGDRLVWIARPQLSGGLLVMTAIVNEPDGLRDVTLAELPRKSLRRMHDDLRTRHAVRMVEADGEYCDALVAEGWERVRAAGHAEAVGRYPTLRARMTTADPVSLEPPLITRVAGPPATDAAVVANGGRLVDEIEFSTWIPDRETMAPHLAAITAARESPIVLSRPQQEERAQAALVETRHALFGGDRAPVYRRRLEEMAYVLYASDGRELAATAAATAAALAGGDDGTPFFIELLRRAVSGLLVEDETKARAEAEGSLLVRPGSGALPPPPRRPR